MSNVSLIGIDDHKPKDSMPTHCSLPILGKDTKVAKLLGLVDDMIFEDPDKAERFIESITAKNNLQKRLINLRRTRKASADFDLPAPNDNVSP